MESGGIDIYNSRRGNFEYCKYWNRDLKSSIPLTDLVNNKAPDGVFYAREENSQYDNIKQSGNSFMFDDSAISVSTEDDVRNIKVNAVVLYQDVCWRVADVQRLKVKKRSQFSNVPTYRTFLRLVI